MMLKKKENKNIRKSSDNKKAKKPDMSDMRGDKRGTERKIVLDNLKKNPNIRFNTFVLSLIWNCLEIAFYNRLV